MSTKILLNLRCECSLHCMGQATQLWLWETHRRLFTHGAELLPARWPLSISTFQRRKDKQELNSSRYQQHFEMTQSFWLRPMQLAHKSKQMVVSKLLNLKHETAPVPVNWPMEYMKLLKQNHKLLLNTSKRCGIQKQANHLLFWFESVARFLPLKTLCVNKVCLLK